jgi:hypothetical protein
MPRGAVIATTLIFGVGMGSVAGADGRSRTARGWISAVDTGTKTIRVKGKNDEVAFKLQNGAKVMENDNAATFAALEPGEHVRVLYRGAGTDRIAFEVQILARAPASSQVEIPE